MLDIRSFSRTYNVPFLQTGDKHCHAGWVQLHCPLCDGKTGGWHLGFSLNKGVFNCWRCGQIAFKTCIGLLIGSQDSEAVKQAIRQCSTDLSSPSGTLPAPEQRVWSRRRNCPTPSGAGPLRRPHRRYLQCEREQGFEPAVLEKDWGMLGVGPASSQWAWRIVYPIHNQDGSAIACWQGRAIAENVEPKYWMSKREDCLEDPGGLLYGQHLVPRDAVIVVEGVADVWRLGFGAVCTFGIDWTVEQANRLRQYRRRYILFDPEDKAQERAEQLARHLALFPGTTEILSGFRCDPSDLSQRRADRIMAELEIR